MACWVAAMRVSMYMALSVEFDAWLVLGGAAVLLCCCAAVSGLHELDHPDWLGSTIRTG